MKKKIILLGLSIFMITCKQKPEDIKLSDMNNACDYLNAAERIIDAFLERTKWENLSDEEKEGKNVILKDPRCESCNLYISENKIKELIVLADKFNDLDNAASKKYTIEELQECNDYDRLKIKFSIFGNLIDEFRKQLPN
jgi:hypothetical protein